MCEQAVCGQASTLIGAGKRMPSEPVRILLADQQILFRHSLALALAESGWPQIDQVGTAEALDHALETQHYHVLIIDRTLPHGDAIGYCQALAKPLQILILTGYEQEAYELQMEAWQAGAAGCLSKEHPVEVYLEAVRALSADRVLFQHSLLRAAMEHSRNEPHQPVTGAQPNGMTLLAKLTPRELEILRLISKSCPNHQIARELSIAENTVMKHVSNIISKLKVRNRGDAGMLYIRYTPGDE
jgi:DNA-binding NarL/FixJ family response regulator